MNTPDVQTLRHDGDALDISDTARLVLRVEPDPDTSINDYDSDGRVEWSSRSDYGSRRPDGVNGAAVIIERDGGSDLWWQPYEGVNAHDEIGRIRELIEYGFVMVGLELQRQCDRGDWHAAAVEWVGGCDSVYPELVTDLLAELDLTAGTTEPA